MFPKSVCQCWCTWVGWLVIWYGIFHLGFASLRTTPINFVDHKPHSLTGTIIVPPWGGFFGGICETHKRFSLPEERSPHIQEHSCWLEISLDCELPISSLRVSVKMDGSQLMCSRVWKATFCWVDRQLPNCFLREHRKERHHSCLKVFCRWRNEKQDWKRTSKAPRQDLLDLANFLQRFL